MDGSRRVRVDKGAAGTRARLERGGIWRQLCAFVEAIEQERTPYGLAAAVLDRLTDLLCFDHAYVLVHDKGGAGGPPLILSRHLSRRSGRDKEVALFVASGKGSCMLRIGGRLSPDDSAYSILIFRRKPFTRGEKAVAASLGPHLRNLLMKIMEPHQVLVERLAATTRGYGLSWREREVVALLCARLTTKEIAGRLKISPRTAAKHLEHVYRRLEVRSRRQAREVLIAKDLARRDVQQVHISAIRATTGSHRT